MIAPSPGADPADRLRSWATPPDGAGPIGPEGAWPQPSTATRKEVLSALNPLHHVPLVGTIYRAATGEDIPPALKIAGSAIFGGPVGVLGSIFMNLLEELITLGPDTSRPAVPEGMQVTGSEVGMSPVSPGTGAPDGYLTLATTQPAFLSSPTMYAEVVPDAQPGSGPDAATQQRGARAYRVAETEWERCCRVEKGLA